jgi:hypothetical protein
VCELGLRHAPPLATTAKEYAEGDLTGHHPANLASGLAALNDLGGQVAAGSHRFLTCGVIDFPWRLNDSCLAARVELRPQPRRWRMPMPGQYLLALVVSVTLAIAALAQDVKSPTGKKAMIDPQMIADRYVAVWNETDEMRRRDSIAALWVPNGQHFVQDRKAQGYEELENRVRGSNEKNVRDDGNRFRAVPGARHLPGVVTFYWEMLPANADTVLVKGLEFLIINDEGRVLVDYQFFPA